MIEAFGPAAERYARTLADDAARTVLVVDPALPAPAFARAVALRRAGIAFDVALALEEPRALIARALAELVLQQVTDYDGRRAAFDQLAAERLPLNGTSQAQMRAYDDRQLATLRDLLSLAETVAVRSWREEERLARVLGRRFRTRRVLPASRSVPAAPPRGTNTVVWAPDSAAGDAAIAALALEEQLEAGIVVARGGVAGVRARFVAPDAADAALRAAAVVVLAADDPAAAVAFARAGYCLAVASTSGALEYVDGAATFEPWDRRSISDAVSRARGTGPARPSGAHGDVVASAAAALPAGGPLVSMVIPAYRRFDDLRIALASIARQTYRDVEAVVVDDAGPHPREIAAVVAEFPFARLFVHETNADRATACNTGLAQARGAFVGFLDEDDELLSDHVARLVEALERTGLDVAHADVLTQFLEAGPGGGLQPYGYAVEMAQSLERTTFLGTNQFGYLSVLFRRSLLERIGALDPAMGICNDYEIVLRAAQHGEFAHVPRITTIYTRRDDDSNMTTVRGDRYVSAHEALFARYPVHGRPAVERQRAAAVAHFRALGGIGKPQPPVRLV